MQLELFPDDKQLSLSEILLERYQAQAIANAEAKDYDVHWTVNDLTGQRFGQLVIAEMTDRRFHNAVVYLAKCDCGTLIEVTARHLSRIDNCGCKWGKPATRGLSGEKRTEPSENIARHHLFALYRNSATRRGYCFELTYEQFETLTTSPCHYCGDAPHQVKKDRMHSCLYNGIDRIDSDGHYTLDNCVPCCGTCNQAKGTKSVEEFSAWIDRLVEHRRK